MQALVPSHFRVAALITVCSLGGLAGSALSQTTAPATKEEMVVTIKTPAAQMKYDVPEFSVTPGMQVKVILVNEDEMPHNLVITKPSNDKGMAVAQAAWALAENGPAKGWVPNDPRIIAASKLVNAHETVELRFTAPTAPGNYPYVCTFPGHAASMNGAMKVSSTGGKLANGKFALYNGKFEFLPDFSTLTPHRQGSLDNGVVDLKFDDYKNDFAVRYTGTLIVPTAGEYTFRLASDDGAKLYIDGKKVVDNDGIHPDTDIKSSKVKLKPGDVAFQLDFFQAQGNIGLFVSWEGPGFTETLLSAKDHPNRKKGKAKKDEETTGIPLVVKDEAVIYRNFIQGVSARGIAVGYPGAVNAAYDAEVCNVALVWQGAFIDAKRHWTGRGVGAQPPLGYSVVEPADGVPFAVLAGKEAPWPATPKGIENGNWPTGYQFKGYRLDKAGIPTFQYSLNELVVTDRLFPVQASKMSHDNGMAMPGRKLQRTIVLKGHTPVSGLYFRAAEGTAVAQEQSPDLFNLADGLKLYAKGGLLRTGNGNRREVLVPVTFNGGRAVVDVLYCWIQ